MAAMFITHCVNVLFDEIWVTFGRPLQEIRKGQAIKGNMIMAMNSVELFIYALQRRPDHVPSLGYLECNCSSVS